MRVKVRRSAMVRVSMRKRVRRMVRMSVRSGKGV